MISACSGIHGFHNVTLGQDHSYHHGLPDICCFCHLPLPITPVSDVLSPPGGHGRQIPRGQYRSVHD